ncbi:MAG: hypothetical protein F4X20_06420 [Dehalococcoidia bacterium]|nr:hypothetical protein [Dehalococcoidia bacterium]
MASGSAVPERIEARLRQWKADGFVERMLEPDPTLWAPRGTLEIEDRLGWLDLPSTMAPKVENLTQFGRDVASEGFTDVVVLGMGGSSLAPEVFQSTFGNANGHPHLTVLDSTHPAAVTALTSALDLSRTLFVVSSKSGATTEMLSFFYHFWAKLAEAGSEPGPHFVAVTDAGTPLERLAQERGFRRVFSAPTDVGGRYSALCEFGLVPAALIGIDVGRLLASVQSARDASDEELEQALRLGATIAECAMAGRDKLTFVTSPSLRSLPTWIEQLIAESTGKHDVGIVPIDQEGVWNYPDYGHDRVMVYIGLRTEPEQEKRENVRNLVPEWAHVSQVIEDTYEISRLMMRWEIATAAAGAVLGINPFDQPDVQLAKDLARDAMAGGGSSQDSGRIISVDDANLEAIASGWLESSWPSDYIGLHVYLAPSDEILEGVRSLRSALGSRAHVATTAGYGPRFLHSTGQLHKGGANNGLFLQIVDDATANDVAVPETDYTFGQLLTAQAAGDAGALLQRGRRVLRVNVGADTRGRLDRLASLFQKAEG